MLKSLSILWVAEAVKAFVESQPDLTKCLTHSATVTGAVQLGRWIAAQVGRIGRSQPVLNAAQFVFPGLGWNSQAAKVIEQ
jgi:hypothetical protein